METQSETNEIARWLHGESSEKKYLSPSALVCSARKYLKNNVLQCGADGADGLRTL